MAHPAPSPAPRASRWRGLAPLLPREHGAWVQLGVPLWTALFESWRSPAAWALGGVAVAGFLAHEHALVLLGHRGRRAHRNEGRRAAVWGALLAAVGLALLLAVGRVAGRDLAWALVVPLTLGAAVGVLVLAGRERTTGGETLAAIAASSWALPVTIAAGLPWAPSVVSCWVWAAGFAGVNAGVRAITTAGARVRPTPSLAVVAATLWGLTFLCSAAGGMTWAGPLALLPLTAAAIWLALWPVPPRRIRTAGWVLTTASTATGAGVLFWIW